MQFAPATIALSALLAAATAQVARADDAAIDPKAKAIFDQTQKTVGALTSVDLVSTMTISGVPAGMLPPGFGQPARFACDFSAPGSENPFGRLYLADASETPDWHCAFDGKNAIRVDAGKKEYATAEGDAFFMVLGEHMSGLPQWLFEARGAGSAEEPMFALKEASMVGSETIDGTECDVIKVVRTMGEEGESITFNEELAIAKTDSLPRRVSQAVEGVGAPAGMKMVTTFSKVNVNPALDASLFSTAVPEGYAKAASPEPMEAPEPELNVKKGDAAPAFSLKTIAGEDVSLDGLKGKIVLLDFWATWCGPCKKAMPSIQKIADEYKDKGVVVYGVNVWERKENAAKEYLEKNANIKYPTLLAGDDLAKAYGVSGIPTLVVIGKDGKVAEIEVGFGGDEGLRKAIDAALAAK